MKVLLDTKILLSAAFFPSGGLGSLGGKGNISSSTESK